MAGNGISPISIGNTSSIRVHFPSIYVSLPECKLKVMGFSTLEAAFLSSRLMGDVLVGKDLITRVRHQLLGIIIFTLVFFRGGTNKQHTTNLWSSSWCNVLELDGAVSNSDSILIQMNLRFVCQKRSSTRITSVLDDTWKTKTRFILPMGENSFCCLVPEAAPPSKRLMSVHKASLKFHISSASSRR